MLTIVLQIAVRVMTSTLVREMPVRSKSSEILTNKSHRHTGMTGSMALFLVCSL